METYGQRKSLVLVIDDRSNKNLVSIELIRKLKLKTKLHPQPYKLSWLNNNNQMVVAHSCLHQIELGNRLKDKVYYDVVEMELANIPLRCTWLYNRESVHISRANTYTVVVNGKQHKLSPINEGLVMVVEIYALKII